MSEKKIHVLGGGTVSYVRPHLALTAPAYGETARYLDKLCRNHPDRKGDVVLHLTKMACGGASSLETNDHVEKLFQTLVEDPTTAIIFMNVAMVDYDGVIDDGGVGGKYGSRLKTREQPNPSIQTKRVPKFLPEVREKRPDIILVAFKTTCNATTDDMKTRGLFLLKGAGCTLVLVNDTGTRINMIVGSDGQCLHQSTERNTALEALVELTIKGVGPVEAQSLPPVDTSPRPNGVSNPGAENAPTSLGTTCGANAQSSGTIAVGEGTEPREAPGEAGGTNSKTELAPESGAI